MVNKSVKQVSDKYFYFPILGAYRVLNSLRPNDFDEKAKTPLRMMVWETLLIRLEMFGGFTAALPLMPPLLLQTVSLATQLQSNHIQLFL